MVTKVGSNIKIFDKEDSILIKVMKDFETSPSKSGASEILASSGGFATLEDITGKAFKNMDIGLNLTITLRKKKVSKDNTSKAKPKTRKPRDDDDD